MATWELSSTRHMHCAPAFRCDRQSHIYLPIKSLVPGMGRVKLWNPFLSTKINQDRSSWECGRSLCRCRGWHWGLWGSNLSQEGSYFKLCWLLKESNKLLHDPKRLNRLTLEPKRLRRWPGALEAHLKPQHLTRSHRGWPRDIVTLTEQKMLYPSSVIKSMGLFQFFINLF